MPGVPSRFTVRPMGSTSEKFPASEQARSIGIASMKSTAIPIRRPGSNPRACMAPPKSFDPTSFVWTDDHWAGLDRDRLIIYELHVGTYTPQGTFAALTEQLLELAHLGVTAIQLMPIADFPGRWNWGYDGVAWWAPSRAYGRPDDLRRLVDEAHRLGLGVILDVVYNHFGPEGAYWRAFSPEYFTDRHKTPWGDAINYDGHGCSLVREFCHSECRPLDPRVPHRWTSAGCHPSPA